MIAVTELPSLDFDKFPFEQLDQGVPLAWKEDSLPELYTSLSACSY
jgi:hypothetical protein